MGFEILLPKNFAGVLVDAKNTAALTVDNKSMVATGDTGVGIILAFNSIGWEPSNILFNTIDALFGLLPADEVPSMATASLINSDATAATGIAVDANSTMDIQADIINAALATSVSLDDNSAVTVAPIIALNKGSAGAAALISGAGTVQTDGGNIAVTADDTSFIHAEVKSAAASLAVGTGKSTSVAVAVSFARNVLRTTVDAGILASGTVNPVEATTGGITVTATRSGSIEALSRAVAATLSVSATSGNSIAVSVGGAVAINRLYGSADASIEDSDIAADTVTIEAKSISSIHAEVIAVAASASVSLSGDSTAVAVGDDASRIVLLPSATKKVSTLD